MKTDKDYSAAHLASETPREAERIRRHPGVEEISRNELVKRAAAIGYAIDPAACFNYVNNANEITYKARAIGWKHTASGMRFAHVDAPRDTLPALQEIRRGCLVIHNGRIWEL